MNLTIKDASELIISGKAEDPIRRFVSIVKTASVTGYGVAINLDDALVSAMVLMKFLDTTEGRKLLKLPKRKNLQYRADNFALFSPQRIIVRRFLKSEISYSEAIYLLQQSLEDADRRTITRLFDDLCNVEKNFEDSCKQLLYLAGADGSNESQQAAAEHIIKKLGYSVKNDHLG